MTPYKSKSGKGSGVTAFEISDRYLKVQFNDKLCYIYDYDSEIPSTIEKMKALALAQKGLSTFISQKKPGYSKHFLCK